MNPLQVDIVGGESSRQRSSTLDSLQLDSRSTFSSLYSIATDKPPNNKENNSSGGNEFQRSDTFQAGGNDEEEDWTAKLLDEYVRVAHKYRDGDVPLPAAFGRESRFWRLMVINALSGGIMGLAGCGLMNAAEVRHYIHI